MRKWWEATLRDEPVSDAGGSVDSAPAAVPASPPTDTGPDVDNSVFEELASWSGPEETPASPLPAAATATRTSEHAEVAKPVVPTAADQMRGAPDPQPPTQPVQPPTQPPQQPVQQYQPPQPVQQQPAQPQPPQQQQWTPEQIAAARQDVINRISPTFTFSEEQIIQLQTEPEKVLPTLAAQIFVSAYETLLPAVVQQIAPMVQHQIQTNRAQAESEDRFFGRWPELKKVMNNDAQASAEVMRIAQTYSRMYPQSDPGKWIEEVGALASVRLGLPIAAPQQAVQAPPPVARPQPTSRPFSPANPNGAASGVPKAPPETNEFMQFIAEWEDLERRH